jgi:hypothetical protein
LITQRVPGGRCVIGSLTILPIQPVDWDHALMKVKLAVER